MNRTSCMKNLRFYRRYIARLFLLILFLLPYIILMRGLTNNDLKLNSNSISNLDKRIDISEIVNFINEFSNVSSEQLLFDPNVILQALRFMIQETPADDPKLIEFVKTLIVPPSKKPLNLTESNKKEFSQMDQSSYIDKVLKEQRNGFFIEAGAYDGEAFSNTLFFELERNWTGLLIEPVPSNYKSLLQKNRNAYTINACIADNKTSVQRFNILHVLSGRDSAMSKDNQIRLMKEGYQQGKHLNTFAYLPCFPLYTILKALNVNRVDYFSLDVEGGELSVIQSIPYDLIYIKSFSIEGSSFFSHTDTIINHLAENSFNFLKNSYNELYFCRDCAIIQ